MDILNEANALSKVSYKWLWNLIVNRLYNYFVYSNTLYNSYMCIEIPK